MYWIYIILFVFMIATPELIQDGILFFSEEEFESLLIFCFGMIGLLLYLSKESAFLRTVREKLSLQKETNQIRKDLSQSYSYIGEMNRRIDIVRNMVVSLPHAETLPSTTTDHSPYEPILEATKLLAQSECVGLYFVATETGAILGRYEVGDGEHHERMKTLDGQYLVGIKKYLWEEDQFSFVRSPKVASGISAFLVFHKMKNQLEETGIFQILAAEALFVFSMHEKTTSESERAVQ